jgi:hypothetical protein
VPIPSSARTRIVSADRHRASDLGILGDVARRTSHALYRRARTCDPP